jgi:hypothetical protein
VLDQRRQGPVGGDRRLDGPGGDQAAVQRHPVEDLDLRAALDDPPRDDVDAVPLGRRTGDLGQIPAFGRGGPARPLAAVQGAAAAEDAVDGPLGRHLGGAALREGGAEGGGALRPQGAVGQRAADAQHQVFHGGVGASRLARGARAVGPIDAVQALPLGPLEPAGDGGDADAEPPRDGPKGPAVADGGYPGTATLGLRPCLLIHLLPKGSV